MLAKQRSAFETEDSWIDFERQWNGLVASPTTAEYDQRLEQLCQRVPAKVFTYLSTTWLCHKDRFVQAWICQIKHFGHVTTSRGEGAHAGLKK